MINTKPKEAPQAFQIRFEFPAGNEDHPGITIWDWYAAHAPISSAMLGGFLESHMERGIGKKEAMLCACEDVAWHAAAYADAMIAERQERNDSKEL